MMAYFRGGPDESGVVMWKMSRFARDIDDSQFYKADLRRRGYKIFSLADNIPEGPEGRFFEAAIDWMNQRFLEDLSRDVSRGLRNLVLTHGCIPGTPPRGMMRGAPINLGVRRDGTPHIGHPWIPDPAVQPLVRQAFDMRAAGATLREVHAATGLYKSLSSYNAFFTNKIYIGTLEYAELVVENYCEPSVAAETFQRVQAVIAEAGQRQNMNSSSQRNPRRLADTPYLLSGLIYCARCSAPMYGKTSGASRPGSQPYERYACTRSKNYADCDMPSVPRQVVERAVLDTLRDVVSEPEFVSARQAERHAMHAAQAMDIDRRRQEIQPRLSQLRRQLENVANAIAEHGMSRTLSHKLTTLEQEEARALADMASLADERNQVPIEYTTEEIETMTNNLRQALSDIGHVSVARMLLRGIIERINVDRADTGVIGQIIVYVPPGVASTDAIPLGAPIRRRYTVTVDMLPGKIRPKRTSQ
jgi:DNA invertase Pin-like site-specific DNA recombinase